ncbi:hypothetical protein [Luteibacter sp.]|jgi:hypothetical protein|uniref:hypothetical protein n=1 Tax=Luteibacter sp. TaxID=1886636 RepID=UPI002F42A367
MKDAYAEAIRTTFHPAIDARSGAALSPAQIEEIVKFAHSDASGARPDESLVALVERKYLDYRAELPSGTQYVAFSGVTERVRPTGKMPTRTSLQQMGEPAPLATRLGGNSSKRPRLIPKCSSP